jgi:cytochrome subunit of sulfide dehydrogenase
MSGTRTAMIAAIAGIGIAAFSGAHASAQSGEDVSVLAGTCANCHGTDGISPGPIESIAGTPYRVLKAQLEAFKAGEDPRATIMARIARGYSDEQLDALARYFSEISQ